MLGGGRFAFLTRWTVKLALSGLIAVLSLIGLAATVIADRSDGLIHTEIETLPARSVVIVPGARVFPDGRTSLMVQGRLDGALALRDAGLVDHVLVSGDNRETTYNEPVTMRNALVDAGVPAEEITLDYAGLDTWDTCLRAGEQFGVEDAIVVTQRRHAERTASLCRAAGIDVVVLAVDHPPQRRSTKVRVGIRESLAKVKAWGDIIRTPPARHAGPFIGLVGSVDMPEGGHPPDWNWENNSAAGD